MKIEVHHIPSNGLSLSAQERADRFASLKQLMDSGECEFVAPVSIDLQVQPMRDYIRVKGRIHTAVRQACVRCAEMFDGPLKSRFTLNYSKEIPMDLHRSGKDGIELTAQQIGIIYYEGDEIDFTDALQEQVVLALPIKPLCSENCKGLCPRCGADLNQGACQCADKEDDGPFAVLKKMKLPPE